MLPHWVRSGIVSKRRNFRGKKIIGREYAGNITDMQSIVRENRHISGEWKNK